MRGLSIWKGTFQLECARTEDSKGQPPISKDARTKWRSGSGVDVPPRIIVSSAVTLHANFCILALKKYIAQGLSRARIRVRTV